MPNPSAKSILGSRKGLIFFTASALILRLFFLGKFSQISYDSFIYGDITKNWLLFGVFGLSEKNLLVPTMIRLPGYPVFMGLVWAFSGIEHYDAILIVQVLIDLASCFVIAGIARRVASERAARIAFGLAALCPFTASYAATALSETLSIFFSALALYCAVRCFEHEESQRRWWVYCGGALACCILLRPDGVVLFGSIVGYGIFRIARSAQRRREMISLGLLLATALSPLVPWTARNWQVFHQFQPLAPRYAEAPGEFVAHGFNRWMRTWVVDYVSTEDVWWRVPGQALDISLLPRRAFDSAREQDQTAELFGEYNKEERLNANLDAQFGQLAAERIRRAPLRYYFVLPALRVLDMWLRPRTELFPIESRWWEFDDHPSESLIALSLASLNALYLLLALAAFFLYRNTRPARWIENRAVGSQFDSKKGPQREDTLLAAGMFAAFMLLRSILLATLENPEPRYTLECFPAVLVLAAATLAKIRFRHKKISSLPASCFS